jgi:hypothetical protein
MMPTLRSTGEGVDGLKLVKEWRNEDIQTQAAPFTIRTYILLPSGFLGLFWHAPAESARWAISSVAAETYTMERPSATSSALLVLARLIGLAANPAYHRYLLEETVPGVVCRAHADGGATHAAKSLA